MKKIDSWVRLIYIYPLHAISQETLMRVERETGILTNFSWEKVYIYIEIQRETYSTVFEV